MKNFDVRKVRWMIKDGVDCGTKRLLVEMLISVGFSELSRLLTFESNTYPLICSELADSRHPPRVSAYRTDVSEDAKSRYENVTVKDIISSIRRIREEQENGTV